MRDTTLPVGPTIDTTPARRPEPVNLAGRFVTLTPLDPAAQVEALFTATHGADRGRVWTYLFDGPFPDRETFAGHLRQKAASRDPLFLAIVGNRTRIPIGYAAYMRIEPAHRVIEVGSILFAPELQRTAGATEAMYLMARHVFEDLGYRRYEWKCDALNAASRRAALRLGFSFEGIFRQHMIVKGRSRDTAWYSMLDSEWPACRRAFERWLSPANFDDDGRQRMSLAALRT